MQQFFVSVPGQADHRHTALLNRMYISVHRFHAPPVGKGYFGIVGDTVVIDEDGVISVLRGMQGHADLVVGRINGVEVEDVLTDDAVNAAVIGLVPSGKCQCAVPEHLLKGEVQHIDATGTEGITCKYRIFVGVTREYFRADALQKEFLLILHGKRASVGEGHGIPAGVVHSV